MHCQLIFFFACVVVINSQLPTCGTFVPTKWVNAPQNSLTTLTYGAPTFDISNAKYMPYLYGCKPQSATSDGYTVSYTYNAQGLVTNWNSNNNNASFIATYIELATGTGYWINTIEINLNGPSPLHHNLVARYDADHRIVGLITSEEKRSVQQIDGNTNYHYNSIIFNRPSEVDFGWHGYIEEEHLYTYTINQDSTISTMNKTVQKFGLPDVAFFYEYLYNSTQLMTICTNKCTNNRVDFSYDKLNRLSGIKESVGIQSTILYNDAGQVQTVTINNKKWTLTY